MLRFSLKLRLRLKNGDWAKWVLGERSFSALQSSGLALNPFIVYNVHYINYEEIEKLRIINDGSVYGPIFARLIVREPFSRLKET